MEVKPTASLAEFFHEALSSALKNQRVEASEMTEFYLVQLLSEFSTVTLDDEPLALRLAETVTAAPEARARTLRDIGDRSLYLSGFFADSLERGAVGVNYYIKLGESAYLQLAHMPARGTPSDVYRELSGKFARFVDVLAEVSEGGAIDNDLAVVQLYERWRRKGSEWLARRLRAKGMIPGGGGYLQ